MFYPLLHVPCGAIFAFVLLLCRGGWKQYLGENDLDSDREEGYGVFANWIVERVERRSTLAVVSEETSTHLSDQLSAAGTG